MNKTIASAALPNLSATHYRPTVRRAAGALLGGGMGLLYGVTSLYANLWLVPGVPLYTAEPGRGAGLLLSALGGAVLGLAAAWPATGLYGALASGLTGALMVLLTAAWQALGAAQAFASVGFLLFYTFLPMVILVAPLGLLLRWGVHALLGEDGGQGLPWGQRLARPLLVIALAGGIGWLSLTPPAGREALRQLDALLRQTGQAESVQALPPSFRSVEGFLQGARGAFSLEYSEDLDLYQGPKPDADISGELTHFLIIVRYPNGFRFTCLFGEHIPRPLCEEMR